MQILYLTIKAKYFDMIVSGAKKQEYREKKPYWIKRLQPHLEGKKRAHALLIANGGHFGEGVRKALVELKGISVGEGKQELGAEKGKEYFILELGDIIDVYK